MGVMAEILKCKVTFLSYLSLDAQLKIFQSWTNVQRELLLTHSVEISLFSVINNCMPQNKST